MILLSTIFLPSKRFSGHVECNYQIPAIFYLAIFQQKVSFVHREDVFFYNFLLLTQIIHNSKPCREIFVLLKLQKNITKFAFLFK